MYAHHHLATFNPNLTYNMDEPSLAIRPALSQQDSQKDDLQEQEQQQPKAPSLNLLAENAILRPQNDIDSEQSASATSSKQDYYTSVQWTADGTSLLVSSALNSISTFVLPEDLLDPSA